MLFRSLPDHLFQRLAVALVHRQKEKRKHGEHHHQSGGAGAQAAPEEKEQRNADERAAAEADQLGYLKWLMLTDGGSKMLYVWPIVLERNLII